MAPRALAQVLGDLTIADNADVLIGFRGADDAGVIRVSEDMVLIQTVDFFTPIVDDPFDYGRIAALNALNDVWAMGGRAVSALAITAFPKKGLDYAVLTEIMQGGASVLNEQGVALLGGHSVDNDQIMFGYSVTGVAHPRQLTPNSGAVPGDVLILTKPLGTGIVSTAIKFARVPEASAEASLRTMLNSGREAAELMVRFGVRAATDVTGFGLMGHAWELAKASHVSLHIDAAAVPVIEGARELAEAGNVTGADKTNREYVGSDVSLESSLSEGMNRVLFDPQTAGGLLIAVSRREAEPLLEALRSAYPHASLIGHVEARGEFGIIVR